MNDTALSCPGVKSVLSGDEGGIHDSVYTSTHKYHFSAKGYRRYGFPTNTFGNDELIAIMPIVRRSRGNLVLYH